MHDMDALSNTKTSMKSEIESATESETKSNSQLPSTINAQLFNYPTTD